MDNKLITLFNKIQAVPYKCRAEISKLDLNVPYANCSQKRELLKRTLDVEGYKTRYLDGIFNWKDLPIPPNILRILKKSRTLQKHHLLEVFIDGAILKVDPTWNLELECKGFPVTKNWDGKSDTKQITNGKIIYYNPKIQTLKLPYFPDERERFAQELNKWLGWNDNYAKNNFK